MNLSRVETCQCCVGCGLQVTKTISYCRSKIHLLDLFYIISPVQSWCKNSWSFIYLFTVFNSVCVSLLCVTTSVSCLHLSSEYIDSYLSCFHLSAQVRKPESFIQNLKKQKQISVKHPGERFSCDSNLAVQSVPHSLRSHEMSHIPLICASRCFKTKKNVDTVVN